MPETENNGENALQNRSIAIEGCKTNGPRRRRKEWSDKEGIGRFAMDCDELRWFCDGLR
jgi:hypothetical protein